MKRNNVNAYILCLIFISLIFSLLTIYALGNTEAKEPRISAKSAVLYVPDINKFIYSKNADVPLPMASTTKIMTALVALESCNLDEEVAIDDSAIGVEGSSAYLRSGDVLTMEELLYALLLQSANDAAVAIACHVSGSVQEFSMLMNSKAEALGLVNTHFANPHGLDDDEHFTTARELAIIAACALKNDTFKQIVSTYKKTFSSEDRCRTYVNHNKLLKLYDGCVGVKTGFTKKSGRCLVGAAEKDGLLLVTVTLDAPSDWNDHAAMLNCGFNNMEYVEIAKPGEISYRLPVLNSKSKIITVSNKEGLNAIINSNEKDITEHLKLSRYVVAPIRKGDVLGEIIYTHNGAVIGRLILSADCDAEEKKSLWENFLSLFK